MPIDKRLALLFPDGSMTVLPPDASLHQARRDATSCDENQTNPVFVTRLVRLWIGNPEVLEIPSLAGAPTSKRVAS